MRLPRPRGPLSAHVVESLSAPVHDVPPAPPAQGDALAGDDLHLALYACYELHYQSFDGVDPDWEWEPSLLALRRDMEAHFEHALEAAVARREDVDPTGVEDLLRRLIDADPNPGVGRHLARVGTLEQFREFAAHRSAYQLKEADPHSWAIPRLRGRAKAALVEIQADEYGSGDASRIHAAMFGGSLRALGLDPRYGAYLDRLPGVTLATVNLMSMFGLHRRLRGACVGHLAVFEMTSSEPNRRYANTLRRLGLDGEATAFYDEHVEADSTHEVIAAHDLAGALAIDEPDLAADIVFGGETLLHLEGRFAAHLLDSWSRDESSLLAPEPAPLGV